MVEYDSGCVDRKERGKCALMGEESVLAASPEGGDGLGIGDVLNGVLLLQQAGDELMNCLTVPLGTAAKVIRTSRSLVGYLKVGKKRLLEVRPLIDCVSEVTI